MKKIFIVFLAIFLTLCLANKFISAEDKVAPDAGGKKTRQVLAEVNSRKIYTDIFEKLIQGRSDPQTLIDQIISFVLLGEEAKKEGMIANKEVSAQLEMLKEHQLAQFLYAKEVEAKAELADDEIKKLIQESDKYKVNFQQIVVKSEAEAQEILKSLKNGADFNHIAKTRSIAKNASKGGQIGYVIPNTGYFEGELSQEDEKKIFRLKNNELSEPIKTRQGYAIFRSVSRKDLSDEEMDSRKNYMMYKFKKEKIEQVRDSLLNRLMSNAKTEIMDNNIKVLEKAEKVTDKHMEMVMAKVNKQEIKLREILPPQRGEYGHQINSPYLNQPGFLKNLITEKVNNILFVEEAKRLKYDNNDEFKEEFDLLKDGLLGQAYAMEHLKDLKPSDEELKEHYEQNKERFKDMPERIKVRHILLPDEEKAKEVLKKVKAGEDFVKLAKEYSICPSAANGGDLGYFSKGRMAPLFEEAAFKLKNGETSDIVRTNFGYHIIKKEDHKQAGASGFNDVKYEIEQNVMIQKRDKKIKDIIADLKSKAKIKINQEALRKYESAASSFPVMPSSPDISVPVEP
ncbi:peptidylprolyl isomerase [bacterium]|nr:peptidylprolyl isomerase [bacterium]